jgi:hypothetical protein
MKRYKLKSFSKWAKKEGLTNEELNKVLDEMDTGLLGDRLGSNVFKKRVALQGRGKRGGARTIVLYKAKDVALFIEGYAKNDKADLEPREEKALRKFADEFIKRTPEQLKAAEVSGAIEVL